MPQYNEGQVSVYSVVLISERGKNYSQANTSNLCHIGLLSDIFTTTLAIIFSSSQSMSFLSLHCYSGGTGRGGVMEVGVTGGGHAAASMHDSVAILSRDKGH